MSLICFKLRFLQIAEKVGPGFCPEIMRKAGGGFAGDQTNAMLALVGSDCASVASDRGQKLPRSVLPPLPSETALLGFAGGPF